MLAEESQQAHDGVTVLLVSSGKQGEVTYKEEVGDFWPSMRDFYGIPVFVED